MDIGQQIKQMVKERDEAFTDFVLTDSDKKVKAYCRKYGVRIPRSKKVFSAGIYKAVQYCTSILEDVKNVAMRKCLDIGFSPFMNFGGDDDTTEGT